MCHDSNDAEKAFFQDTIFESEDDALLFRESDIPGVLLNGKNPELNVV